MRNFLKKFILFFFKESFFFDNQAKPIKKIKKRFTFKTSSNILLDKRIRTSHFWS